jgi:tetratricopeptide (TPR) repeat protein
MPRLNTSRQVKQRTRQLLEKLLNYANYELPESENFADKLVVRWKNETGSAPELVVETELKVLIELAFEQEETPRLKDQLRNDLRVLEEFLQILEDNRARTQGAKRWRFTLKLWDKSTHANLDAFEKTWDQRKHRKPRGINAPINVPNLSVSGSQSSSSPALESDGNGIPAVPEADSDSEDHSCTLNTTSVQPVRYINLSSQNATFSVNQTYLNRLLNLLSFDQPDHLITLEGAGGVGKTTLAIAAAHRCLEASQVADAGLCLPSFEAIIFASAQTQQFTGPELSPRLNPQRNLQDIFRTIFRTLGRADAIPPDFNEQIDYVRDCLGQQKTLLIVDNLETLEDRDYVLSFLKEIPLSVKVIVTSRVRLGLGTTIHIRPLSLNESIELIQQQAQSLELSLTPAQLRQLHQQTGGLPLAITYTLGMISAFGIRPEDINIAELAQPDGDFARHCFKASVQRLRGQASHNLLMAFALFRRPALPEALAHVAFPSDYLRHHAGPLQELYRLSLIDCDQERYTMHSLTREYARSELANHPAQEQEARERWVEWYLAFLTVNGEEDWYDWHPVSPIESEWENLREVVEWCQAQGRYDDFLDFWEHLKGYTQIYGHWTERLDWMKWLMVEAEKRLDKDTLADAMYHYSRTLFFSDQSKPRSEAIEVAHRIWEIVDLDNHQFLIDVAILLSTLYTNKAEYQSALAWINRGQDLLDKASFKDISHTRQWVSVPYYKAELYSKLKNYDEARKLYDEALDRASQMGWKRASAYIQGALGVLELSQGNLQKAKALLNSLLRSTQSHHDLRCQAFCYRHLAQIAKLQDDLASSHEYAVSARKYFDFLNMKEQSLEIQTLLEN